jgi:hypothetical protein
MNPTFFSSFTGTVDRTTGVITGVSVATIGEARGHAVKLDRTTLDQLKALADKAGSVRVGIDHWSGFEGIAGSLRAFRIEGDNLRADLHLLENHPARERILEMAEKMPGNFGLSIAYVGSSEEKDGVAFARISELLSVDLVDAPAANPSGLFAAPDGTERIPEWRESLESIRNSMHTAKLQLLERDATIAQLRRDKELLEARCTILTKDMDMLASMKAAQIASQFGTLTPANVTARGPGGEFGHMTGIDLAKAANQNRQL